MGKTARWAIAFAIAAVVSVHAQPRPATISGRVVDATTGAPLRKTTLTLRPTVAMAALQQPGQNAGGPGAINMMMRQQSATTAADGSFSFTLDQPGEFRIGADRTGYVRGEYGAPRPSAPGKAVKVTVGQSVTDIEIKLLPQGVIAGRVVDEDGDPVERAQVTVMSKLGPAQQQSSTVVTNDLGEFRASGLAAGKYYLMVMRLGIAMPPAKPSDEGEETYSTTYFPGTIDIASAAPITLTPGQQVNGIFVPLKKGRVFRVTGSTSGTAGEYTPNVSPPAAGQPITAPASQRVANTVIVSLVERTGTSGPRMAGRTLVSNMNTPDGGFEVTNVPPGSYWAIATTVARNTIIGRTAVEVRNGNVANVVISVAPPVAVAGLARADGRETVKVSGARVQFAAIEDGTGNSVTAQVQADGSFQLPTASRTQFRVSAQGLPNGVYLKSVRVSGQDTGKLVLDLTNAPATMDRVELVFSAKAATITGRLARADGSLPGSVLLVPDPYLGEPPAPPVGVALAVADAGTFKIQNVPPGKYRLYAFEDLETQMVDADLLRPLETRGEAVAVDESDSATVELKQIPADAVAH